MLVQKVVHWVVLLSACPSNSSIIEPLVPPSDGVFQLS
jgi:hypothetical protein